MHTYYILTPRCDKSIFNTDMWLSQKHCFIGRCYTVPCKSHRGHTFHFYLYRVSELNTHKYLYTLHLVLNMLPNLIKVQGVYKWGVIVAVTVHYFAGFKGNARVILPGISACIDCTMDLYPPQVHVHIIDVLESTNRF